MCTSEGRIVEVLHDSFGHAKRGDVLADMVEEAEREKCARFLENLASEGAVFGWEMHHNDATLVFAAFESGGLWLVIGTEEPALIERLHMELMGINSELTNSLRDAHKQHSLSRRSAGPSLDDFARLSNEMSALHREIAKRARDLEQLNRVYEHRQAEVAALDERREGFLQHLVHDLRSPLTSVNGAVVMALSGVLGPIDDGAREALVLAKEGCERLTEMIAMILDTAKAEAGQLDLTNERVSVHEAVEVVERELRNRATEADVAIDVQVDPTLVVLGDFGIIRRVLANYVVNALKFSPPGKTIRITARTLEKNIRVSVTDEGPGIPEALRERLFKKYGQIERRGMSTGLGLAFCREMVRAMSGTVGVDNNEGNGATFWFELRKGSA